MRPRSATRACDSTLEANASDLERSIYLNRASRTGTKRCFYGLSVRSGSVLPIVLRSDHRCGVPYLRPHLSPRAWACTHPLDEGGGRIAAFCALAFADCGSSVYPPATHPRASWTSVPTLMAFRSGSSNATAASPRSARLHAANPLDIKAPRPLPRCEPIRYTPRTAATTALRTRSWRAHG